MPPAKKNTSDGKGWGASLLFFSSSTPFFSSAGPLFEWEEFFFGHLPFIFILLRNTLFPFSSSVFSAESNRIGRRREKRNENDGRGRALRVARQHQLAQLAPRRHHVQLRASRVHHPGQVGVLAEQSVWGRQGEVCGPFTFSFFAPQPNSLFFSFLFFFFLERLARMGAGKGERKKKVSDFLGPCVSPRSCLISASTSRRPGSLLRLVETFPPFP